MSLYEFPPIGSADRPVCLQEMNGGLIYGTQEELQEIELNELLCDLPKIEKSLLNAMQQSLSHDNVRETFADDYQGRFLQAVDNWKNKGINSLANYASSFANSAPYGEWLTLAGHAFRKAQTDIASVFTKSEENLIDSIAQTSCTLDWPTNWIRCIAVHSSGHRIAVCQNNDCIRIFQCGSDRPPITLKHHSQQNVTDMAWKPFDRMVLAVACSHAVLIWRLDKQNINIRISGNCAEVIELPSFSPVTQCFWDSVFDHALFIASASSSQMQVLDTTNAISEKLGCWSRSHIRHVWISPDGSKLAVAYDANFFSVYDRNSWHEERWKKLNGPCTAAVWTSRSDVLFFATHDEPYIRGIHFVKKLQNMDDDQSSSGSGNTVPVYDLSEAELENADNSLTYKVGGSIRDMKVSPDGQRMAVTFNANPGIIALFVVETVPAFFFAPCGLINGGAFGAATIASFFPKFHYGSLLIVAWSIGKLQYIPLIYGHHASEGAHLNKFRKQKPLNEMSAEELIVRESLLSRRTNSTGRNPSTESSRSRSRESANENLARSRPPVSDLKLFSSSGLYDQLVMKSSEKPASTEK